MARRQFHSDRVALGAALPPVRQHVRPPLQPDLTGQRLGDLLAHAGDLDIEGIEREQRPPPIGSNEQGRGVADEVVAADEIGAECSGILVSVLAAHGTAISAAATRRRSPIMML